MTDAAKRILGRLRSLGVQDREWVLCQLSTAERHQVLAALSANDADAVIPEPASTSAGDDRIRTASPVNATSEVSTAVTETTDLDRARSTDVAALLAEQSDWTVAALLGARNWSWTEDVLSMLSPARLGALRELSSALGDTVRPRVREAVIRIVAAQLRVTGEGGAKRSIFDAVLERAEREMQNRRGSTGEAA